jgi:hypothetical protein
MLHHLDTQYTILVHFHNSARLSLIRTRLMIEHSVPIQAYTLLLRPFRQLQQLLLCAPLRRLPALLVELSDIVEVIYVVAVAVGAACFAARRQPDVVDADGLEFGDGADQTLPVFAVGGDVPFEALEQGVVLRRGFLPLRGFSFVYGRIVVALTYLCPPS